MATASAGRRTGSTRTRARTALFWGAAALVAATAVPASAAVPLPAPDDPAVVVDCFGAPQVRPKEYLLACGDGNNQLVSLRWTSWGSRTATATGTDMVNDCRPYCAAGRFRAYPVQVTLSHPKPWPGHADTRRFTMIRLVYPEAAPSPVPHDVTYRLVY
ncbi:hypothetical protein [Streptomyces antimicrobicus]|uniref:Secreted protein n=1 Tax=Streptomyces antimicrobicus TaxID=2883108 RepID=A0ABS8BAA8_9ACTN|nr:hypothetical protein [Streptomyces antimicrobicus]MCB5181564.1 hypothetical protein [Streptomyces antimicrobicus]